MTIPRSTSRQLDQTLAQLNREHLLEIELGDPADLLVEPDAELFVPQHGPAQPGVDDLAATLAAAKALPDECLPVSSGSSGLKGSTCAAVAQAGRAAGSSAGRASSQANVAGFECGRCAVVDLELEEDRREMTPDGLVGDAQVAGDLSIGRTLRQQIQDVALAVSQIRECALHVVLSAAGEEVEDPLCDARPVHRFAAGRALPST